MAIRSREGRPARVGNDTTFWSVAGALGDAASRVGAGAASVRHRQDGFTKSRNWLFFPCGARNQGASRFGVEAAPGVELPLAPLRRTAGVGAGGRWTTRFRQSESTGGTRNVCKAFDEGAGHWRACRVHRAR